MKPIYYLKNLSRAKHKLKSKLLSDATMTFGDNIYIPMPRTQIITQLSARHPRPRHPSNTVPTSLPLISLSYFLVTCSRSQVSLDTSIIF